MDKTALVNKVAHLFRISGCKVDTSVRINYREIDIRAEERQGLVRKIILVECADYKDPVGVQKLQEDLLKLNSAKEALKDSAVVMHVSRLGYSPDAAGYAHDRGLSIFSLNDLTGQLINFDNYVSAVESDQLRPVIEREYQPNRIHFEGNPRGAKTSVSFLKDWLASEYRWLTLLGDYGVGKSWTLKKFLYLLIQDYKEQPSVAPLPFFVPLQNFTKAFDFQNLILRTFHTYKLAGVHYEAFEHLMHAGKIVFLLDSFDEMAQHLKQETIRENLKEMLVGVGGCCKAIMTSRPNYFEGRAERLLVVESDGQVQWHALDRATLEHRNALSKTLQDEIAATQFARIADLTPDQRKQLFRIVLGADSPAYKKLIELFIKFENLDNLAHRAVIARLLTTVAETLASGKEATTIDGYPLIPDELETLNQSKIFEIVVFNLLGRDQNIGSLCASDRLKFLRNFALLLQQKSRSVFATPEEIRTLVGTLYQDTIRRTDAPQQLLESYYRTCRRHSGLTTEGQFSDTSGKVDMLVDEADTESRVGFSHNSLREYLVADALCDYLINEGEYPYLKSLIITDLIGDFVVARSEYDSRIVEKLREKYANQSDQQLLDVLFRLILRFVQADQAKHIHLFGRDPLLCNLYLGGIDLSGLPLRRARIENSLIIEADFRKADLREASFAGSVIEGALFDDAPLAGTDFKKAEVDSIYVFDRFDTNTTAILRGLSALQWLYSNGAIVDRANELNPLMGQPWYEAAREVTRTLGHRKAGTHQDISLAKGTDHRFRPFANEFVEFLMSKGILEKITRSHTGPGWVVKLPKEHWGMVEGFSEHGKIDPKIQPFFRKYLPIEVYQRLFPGAGRLPGTQQEREPKR